jgi:adenylate cyclase
MKEEIERKFLVKEDFRQEAIKSFPIIQAYLSSVPERNVRVRIFAEKGFITVKGKGDPTGASRFEWEKEISINEARALLNLCEPGIIEKERFLVPESSGLTFEVDVFHGDNEGLMVAEIELPEIDYQISKPKWLGKEVTGNKLYYNASLVKNPFNKWKHA